MKKVFPLSLLAAAALGTAWHFLYPALPCPLTALLAPQNESVWEHLKLLYFPSLLVAFFVNFRVNISQRRFWSAVFAALLAMPAALTGAYYALTFGFAVAGSGIALYYAALALGWTLALRLTQTGSADRALGALTIAVGTYGAALVLFSIAAPPLPIFQ